MDFRNQASGRVFKIMYSENSVLDHLLSGQLANTASFVQAQLIFPLSPLYQQPLLDD